MSGWRTYFIIVLVLLLACVPKSQAAHLKVAVASNFYQSLSKLLAESKYANQVKLSSGSSGLLYAQISKGAPFDLFLSADVHRPHLLHQKGLAYEPKTYTIGQLVLWPAVTNAKFALQTYKGKLAIANYKLAPYGKAAMEVLQSLSLKEQYQPRLIMANNINQAFQFVDSGNAKMALIAKSQLVLARQNAEHQEVRKYTNYQDIPASWHKPVTQQMVILKRTSQQALAEKFQAWLLSDKVQKSLIDSGYKGVNG